MSPPPYAFIYQDPFHPAYLGVTTTISVLSNGLLLFIIYTTPSSSVGSYRYLLAVFAFCDIVTSFAHMTLQPLCHLTESGLYFFPRHVGIMIGGQSFDTVFCLIFIATYYQTFLILAYHYVYRVTTVTSGITRSITKYWSPAQWIALGVAVNILYVAGFMGVCILGFIPSDETRALVPPEILEFYGADFHDPNTGFAVISVWRPDVLTGNMVLHVPSMIAFFLLISLFGGTALVIVYCIWRINRVIMASDNHFTGKTRKMQLDLFHALLIQTAIPVTFSYLPLATILVFPVVSGINLGALGNILFFITAIFPCVDAFFVLFFIGRFRLAVIRLFHLPFKAHYGSSTDHHTTDKRTHETSSRF